MGCDPPQPENLEFWTIVLLLLVLSHSKGSFKPLHKAGGHPVPAIPQAPEKVDDFTIAQQSLDDYTLSNGRSFSKPAAF
nr:hypothetical protein Iba_chr05aCG14150 [Ipomoea batatas]GMC98229.1 hypothetical protein Iba_chr05dCG14590 [Ipomoea batatas]